MLLLCLSVPVEINHLGLPESKGGSKIIPFNTRGQCWSFAWNQQTMRKFGEGFDTGHLPEPANKHSLERILMDTFPLVMGPFRQNRKQEEEDEEDRADQWTLRARDP